MTRRLGFVACVLASGLASIGCQPSGGTSNPAPATGTPAGKATSESGKKYRLAVIPKGTTHEFWKSVHAGAEQAAKEAGNVEILWKGSLLENDRDGQISVVQDFVTQKVDGICLAPLDSQALIAYVREAKEAGIPTVIFDSGLDDESDIVSYVATDNYKGGVLAAQQMGKVLEGKGNVILMRYNPGSESTKQREDGFLDALKKDFPDAKILSSDEYAGTTPEASLEKCQTMFQKFKSELNGVFAVCEPNGTGMLGALEETGLAGKVKFITFDPSPRLIDAMTSGQCHGIVLQDPVKMGYTAVKTLVAHLNGQPVEKHISTGEYLATPANMKEPEMDKLLHPVQFGE